MSKDGYFDSKYGSKHSDSQSNSNSTSNVNFLDFLGREIPYDYKLKKLKPRKTPHEPIQFEMDDSHRFRNTVAIAKGGNSTIQALSSSSRNSGIREFSKKRQLEIEIEKQFANAFGQIKKQITVPVEVVDWESQVFESPKKDENVQIKEYVNNLLDDGWEKNICFTEEDLQKNFMTLYIDDPNLIFERIEEKKSRQKKKTLKNGVTEKATKNKYNISNDKYYVTEVKNKISLGAFGVQHSLPALKLDSKFYKTNLTRDELRNFHKPQFIVPNDTFIFKAPSKPNTTNSIIKKSHELSLTDTGKFIIFEYYEEFPFFITNPGMASLMNTYYRRVDTADDPNADNCIILEAEDESPFFGFVDIKPGTFMKTIDNNLFISPIVQHKTTDFLCIFDKNEIIMRPVENLNLVGQQFPKEEVFAPHSRKLNQFCKDRLKVAAYRLFSKGKDILMSQLDQMFPYFSEGSKRKWLKEFCDSEKKGKENVWVLKDSYSIIGEEDLRKLVTPENICQYESMLSSERRMQDLGYKVLETEEEDETYDFYSPSWYLSRNFVNAANGRGLLELSNSTDPASLGESFSFRKIKLKKGNESENRKIITENQSTYKERSVAIWNNHIDAISVTEPVAFVPSESKSSIEMPSETTGTDIMNVLVIKRTYEENGVPVTKIEKIYDGRVIKAYLRARKTVKMDDKKTTFTCSSCGQVGHMKTNKSCPNFVGINKLPKKKIEDKKPTFVYQEKLLKLISNFMAVPFSNAFHRPVPVKKFPNYPLIVKNPIDLGTIRMNLKNNKYRNFDDFISDLKLMRDNCAAYNGANHSLTEIAQSILDIGLDYFRNNEIEIRNLEREMENENNF